MPGLKGLGVQGLGFRGPEGLEGLWEFMIRRFAGRVFNLRAGIVGKGTPESPCTP